jgi:hypothetical protein
VTVHRSNRMIGSCPDGTSAGTSRTRSKSRMRSRSAIRARSHSTWRCSRMARTARSTATRSPRRPLEDHEDANLDLAPLTTRTTASRTPDVPDLRTADRSAAVVAGGCLGIESAGRSRVKAAMDRSASGVDRRRRRGWWRLHRRRSAETLAKLTRSIDHGNLPDWAQRIGRPSRLLPALGPSR